MSGWPYKDPSEVLDYSIRWSKLLSSGETISTATWTVPSGLTNVSSVIDSTHKDTTIWLSGGTSGQYYSISCQITTSASRTFERTATLGVKEK